MLNRYFEDMQKSLTKKKAAKTAPPSGKTEKKLAKNQVKTDRIEKKDVMDAFSKIVPAGLSVAEAVPVDENGFAPEGADFLIFKSYCVDIVSIMEGYVPLELIYASCYVVPTVDKKLLLEALGRVVNVKKVRRYAAEDDEEEFRIPAFIVAGDGGDSIRDIKNDILNYYRNKNIDPDCEFDILVILSKGLIIKNWREKTYIAIETMEDTLMWFFILMSEYIDVERRIEMNFRKYIKSEKNYTEY